MTAVTLLAEAPQIPDLVQEALWRGLAHFSPYLLVIGAIGIGARILRMPTVKGYLAEARVNWFGLRKLPSRDYRVLRNLIIPTGDGRSTCEIDHIVVSAHGVFVIETKRYDNAEIYGKENETMWTRCGRRNKLTFLNPLVQNKGHIKALAHFLDLPQSAFHSVVVLLGSASYRTPLPAYVLNSAFAVADLPTYIQAKRTLVLTDTEVRLALYRLESYRRSSDQRKLRRSHISRVAALKHETAAF